MANQAEADHALHEFLVTSSPDLIYVLDDQGRFTFANKPISNIFERAPADVSGLSWQDVVGPDLAQLLRHHANVAFADIDDLHVPPDVEVGGDRIEKDLLLDAKETFAGCKHRLLRGGNGKSAALARINDPLGNERCGRVRGVIHQITIDRSDKFEGGAELRDSLRDALILNAEQEPLLLQQCGVDVGVFKRRAQGIATDRSGRDDDNQGDSQRQCACPSLYPVGHAQPLRFSF